MKYYLYISDAKVDMLIQQIPHNVKKKIATEFKFDLKILSASRKAEIEDSDDRIFRLETVCEFIRQYGNVGTVNLPREYISDSLDMNWNTYGLEGRDPAARFVYFCGFADRHVVGLAGSVRHLIGHPARSQEISIHPHGSGLPTILEFFRSVTFEGHTRTSIREWNDSWMRQAFKMTQRGGPQQRLEFLAKTLVTGYVAPDDSPARLVTLATPLYVAMAE